MVLVLVHEFGHFYSAKKFGIRVDEFGFGFPPKLFSKKYGETEYSFNALPFGGFVKIFGENPDDENTNGPDAPRSFVNKPKWQQAVVLFAGVFANFVLAWILFSFGFMSGLPSSVDSDIANYVKDAKLTVLAVSDDSPAKEAGLLPGDKILEVSSGKSQLTEINPTTFKDFVVLHPKEDISIKFERKQEIKETILTPEIPSGQVEARVGISMDQIGIAKLPVFKALWEGGVHTLNITKNTVLGLFKLVSEGVRGQGTWEAVTGPVGLVGIVGDVYDFGFVYLLSFTALISINLGVINLVPFPALDGGRLLFLLIEKIKGSKISPKFANVANLIGFVILITLMLVVTYHDIARLF